MKGINGMILMGSMWTQILKNIPIHHYLEKRLKSSLKYQHSRAWETIQNTLRRKKVIKQYDAFFGKKNKMNLKLIQCYMSIISQLKNKRIK